MPDSVSTGKCGRPSSIWSLESRHDRRLVRLAILVTWSFWISAQVKRLRIHASNLAFWYSSDDLPPTDVEQEFLQVFKDEKWPNPLLASASDRTSSLTGPTGVKMSGEVHVTLGLDE